MRVKIRKILLEHINVHNAVMEQKSSTMATRIFYDGRGTTRASDKGGRCLNTCFSNNQNLLHDSVATHLSKALHGGDLRVFKQEDQPFPTINRRTDITVKSLDNLAKPFCYFDTTISNKAADSSDRPKTKHLNQL